MSGAVWDGFKSFWSGFNAGLLKAMEYGDGKFGVNIGAMKSLIADHSSYD
ncbi:MAG: hypothetical protein ABFD50_09035 [Smithella sp.]